MRSFCEVVASEVLPSFRSIITKELTDIHHLNQKEVAKLLGITQPAVSQYLKEARGLNVRVLEKNQDVMMIAEEIVSDLVNQNTEKKIVGSKVCKMCRKIRENKTILSLNNQNLVECPLEV